MIDYRPVFPSQRPISRRERRRHAVMLVIIVVIIAEVVASAFRGLVHG